MFWSSFGATACTTTTSSELEMMMVGNRICIPCHVVTKTLHRITTPLYPAPLTHVRPSSLRTWSNSAAQDATRPARLWNEGLLNPLVLRITLSLRSAGIYKIGTPRARMSIVIRMTRFVNGVASHCRLFIPGSSSLALPPWGFLPGSSSSHYLSIRLSQSLCCASSCCRWNPSPFRLYNLRQTANLYFDMLEIML